jgi:hypothetical protein
VSDSVPLNSLWLIIDMVERRVDRRVLCRRAVDPAGAETVDTGAGVGRLFSSSVLPNDDARDIRVDRRVLCLRVAAAGAVAFCFFAADLVLLLLLAVLVRLVNGFRFRAL